MRKTQRDYTTGEAAEICMVSLQTIVRVFDKGSIEGYYVPGSKHRRIRPEVLYDFMIENNIPTDDFPEKDIPKGVLESQVTE
jgi:excisionase family DNA binding protein